MAVFILITVWVLHELIYNKFHTHANRKAARGNPIHSLRYEYSSDHINELKI